MRARFLMPKALILIFAVSIPAGRGRLPAESGEALVITRSECREVDWTPIETDYSAHVFSKVRISFGGKTVNLVGFNPLPRSVVHVAHFGESRDYFMPGRLSTRLDDAYAMAVLAIDNRHNSWLFLMLKRERLYGLVVSDINAPVASGTIYSEEIASWFDDVVFQELKPNETYVEPFWYPRWKESGVKFPASFRPMAQQDWDSAKHTTPATGPDGQ